MIICLIAIIIDKKSYGLQGNKIIPLLFLLYTRNPTTYPLPPVQCCLVQCSSSKNKIFLLLNNVFGGDGSG